MPLDFQTILNATTCVAQLSNILYTYIACVFIGIQTFFYRILYIYLLFI